MARLSVMKLVMHAALMVGLAVGLNSCTLIRQTLQVPVRLLQSVGRTLSDNESTDINRSQQMAPKVSRREAAAEPETATD